MSTMTPKVWDRSRLSPTDINKVERAQFLPTGQKYQQWYSGQEETIHHLYAAEKAVLNLTSIDDFLRPMNQNKGAPKATMLDQLVVQKNGVQLTYRELGTIINTKNKKDIRPTTQPGLTNEYVEMICRYVHHVRNKDQPMKGPPCLHFTHEQFLDITEERKPLAVERKNYVVLHCMGINSLNAFMELDYLLIPVIKNGTHAVLAGIAPKERFFFVIDSTESTYNYKSSVVDGLVALITTLSPDFRKETEGSGPNWTVFGEWSAHSQTTDGSPDAPRQRDTYNCGIFAATNAFCLAFGFSLLCFEEKDLDQWKKPRMVAEFINGGFWGPGFNYDMLDYPKFREAPPAPYGPSSPRESSSGSRPPTSMSNRGPPRRNSSRLRSMFSSGSKRGRGSDDNEQRGFGDDEGSDGESDTDSSLGFKKQPLYTPALLADYMSMSPGVYKSPASVKFNTATSYPPQFSPSHHQQAIFFYSSPPDGFVIQDRKYSKRELKKACKEWKIKGWQKWSFERQGYFMNWVLNEINGIMARRRGDEVLPFDGIGEVDFEEVESVPISSVKKQKRGKGKRVVVQNSGVRKRGR